MQKEAFQLHGQLPAILHVAFYTASFPDNLTTKYLQLPTVTFELSTDLYWS